MKPIVAPVVADSKRLLRDVASVCADFPQRLKFILSERLVALALDSVLRAQEAARAGKRRPDLQLPLVAALIDCNDRLQALIDAAFDLKRSEERRVGKECVSTCRSRGSRDP